MGGGGIGLLASATRDGAEPLTMGHRRNGKYSVMAENKDGVQVEGMQGAARLR